MTLPLATRRRASLIFPVPDEAATRPVEPEAETSQLSVFQENAQAFASTPEAYAAAERNAAIRAANALRVAGHPGMAHYTLVRSFLRQVRILGLSYAALPGYQIGGPEA